MRNIPIATDDVLFIVTTPPKPRIANRETGEIRQNAAGQSMYQLGVCAIQTVGDREEASAIQVSIPGEPKGITRGALVHFTKLIAMPWEQGDRHGVAYRAESVVPATGHNARTNETKAA